MRHSTSATAFTLFTLFLLLAQPLAFASEAPETDLYALGARGDGRHDDTPAFRAALDAIGDKPATLVIARGTFTVESLRFPSNVTLSFRDGGKLAVVQDQTIEIDGRIDGGTRTLFIGEGDVTGSPDNLHIFPQWFGARGDGVHDDARALQQAADLAAGAMGRTLFIPAGTYLFNRHIELRCNVESRGLLVIELEIDEDRTQFCNDLFLPTHHPKHDPRIRFVADHPERELAFDAFYGLNEGDLTVPVYRQVPLADGSGTIDLDEGGILRFYSSDFFSSRNVRKGAHYYDKNDIGQMVSGRGNVFPEFAFDYDAPPDAAAWDATARYDKGDYCVFEGEVFKATWPSGEGTSYRHRHLGEAKIGPVQPEPDNDSTHHHYAYEDGTKDSILIWRRVRNQVWYRPKDTPVTVNGLRIEVRLAGHEGQTKRIAAGAMFVERSNVTFNNLHISVRDREATMAHLLRSRGCVNNTFNNGYFSGATSAHLGYNILNSNVANFRYNHCISTNSRKGMDGRHGKNIHVTGGFYNIIDDHYGRNYVIRDVTLSGMSVFVPHDSTPQADLQGWVFRPRTTLSFNGANFHIENITVDRGARSVMSVRADIGDLDGTVTLRDVVVRGNQGDVLLFLHRINPNFDYAHEVKRPTRLTIENVTLENAGGVHLVFGRGFDNLPYGPVHVRNATVTNLFSASPETHLSDCVFDNATFQVTDDARIHLRHCRFVGENSGLAEVNLGAAVGNIAAKGAVNSFPINYLNEALFERP